MFCQRLVPRRQTESASRRSSPSPVLAAVVCVWYGASCRALVFGVEPRAGLPNRERDRCRSRSDPVASLFKR